MSQDRTVYSLDGWRGTIFCFHGANKDGRPFGRQGDQKLFLQDISKFGFCYVCPPSIKGTWNDTDSHENPDILVVEDMIAELRPILPFYMLGHSNGGGMVNRMVVFGKWSFMAVQYSNGSCVTELLQNPRYDVASIFAFSKQDPAIPYEETEEDMRVLRDRGIEVIAKDLTKKYQAGGYQSHHQFLNTGKYTANKFYIR